MVCSSKGSHQQLQGTSKVISMASKRSCDPDDPTVAPPLSGTPLTRDSANVRIAVNKSMEGIRALTIDKDNAPKWNPPSLDNVGDEKVDLVFQPFAEDLELEIKEEEANRWDGKYENSAYASFKVTVNKLHFWSGFGVELLPLSFCFHH